MKIEKTEVRSWRQNGPDYVYVKERNVDGPELVKWMRELAKIEAFSLQEIPVFRGNALGRWMMMDVTSRNCVLMFSISEKGGLKKNKININGKYFTNDGTCTQYSCMSKEKMMMSLLKVKDGNRILSGDLKHLWAFKERILDMIKNGGIIPKKTPIQMIMEDNYQINLPSEIKTIKELNEFLLKKSGIEFVSGYMNNESGSHLIPYRNCSYHNHNQLVDNPVNIATY